MKSESTGREYPGSLESNAHFVQRDYEAGVNDIMSALADDFGLETNGYSGAAGREALVEHVRAKLSREIDLPIPQGDGRGRLVEALKPFFLVLAGKRNTDEHTHLVLQAEGKPRRKERRDCRRAQRQRNGEADGLAARAH